MSKVKSLASYTKKRRIIIGCSVAGTAVIMAGAGVGIGYAVFHKQQIYIEGNPEITEFYSEPKMEHYSIEGNAHSNIKFLIDNNYDEKITIDALTGNLTWHKELNPGDYKFKVSTDDKNIKPLDVTLRIVLQPVHIVGDPVVYTRYQVSSDVGTQEAYWATSSSGEPITNREWKLEGISEENKNKIWITTGEGSFVGAGILRWSNTLETGEYKFKVKYEGGSHHDIQPYDVALEISDAQSYVVGTEKINSVTGVSGSEKYNAKDFRGDSIVDPDVWHEFSIDWEGNEADESIEINPTSGVLTWPNTLDGHTFNFKIKYEQNDYSTTPLDVTLDIKEVNNFNLTPDQLKEYFVLNGPEDTIIGWQPNMLAQFKIDCGDFNKIIFDEKIRTINDQIFDGVFQGTNVQIVDASYVITFGASAFANNPNISFFNLSQEYPLEIGESAFENCKNATIPIGITIKSIGDKAFIGWEKLTASMVGKANIDGSNTSIHIVMNGDEANPLGAVLLDSDNSGCVTTGFAAGQLGTWSLYCKTGAEEIEANKFANLASIHSITLDGCKGVNTKSFYKCINLAIIGGIVNGHVIIKGDSTFEGCINLVTVTANSLIFEQTLYSATRSFKDCTSLISISIKENCIPDYTFDGCTALARVISPMVTRVGSYAFNNCSNLTTLSVQKFKNYINDGGFKEYDGVGAYAFAKCVNLKTIYITMDLENSNVVSDTAFSDTSGGGVLIVGDNRFGDKLLNRINDIKNNSDNNLPWANWTQVIGSLSLNK